ncbi:hypothetical protein LS71_005295 [Helicobacter jaachi]|uniref:Glycosyltransferase RgtA/B/C/D-like domain-containing protein n=1 Tax=Helicobacter jaachi TaxID=1677920 RepID=A0A4V6I2L7_9HELI|nr:hypothetical protein LS71_005295 [Helicobacter jaachi]
MLFLPYLLAFGLMLLNTNGYYWDDFALIGNFSFDEMNRQFAENGNVWYGYFEWIFISMQPYGVALSRLFTFCSFFICGVIIYQILKSMRLFSAYEIYGISILFLLLPFNTISRNALINVPYTLCYLLFFVAFFALLYFCASKNTWIKGIYRICALVCFFISFTMNSLLIFYALALAYLLYVHYANTPYKSRSSSSIGWFMAWIWKHIDFILLPIIFYSVKLMYFKPYGLYEGYNAVHLSALLKSFIKTPLLSLLNLVELSYILAGAIGLLALLAVLYMLYKRSKEICKRDVWGIIAGFIIWWLGSFSYVVVHKHTSFLDLQDRFGILESLGVAILCIFTLNAIIKSSLFKHIVLGGIILCAIEVNVAAQNTLFQAYIRQVGIFEHLKENPLFAQFDTFRIRGDVWLGIGDDSFYQLNGLYKREFGKSDKYISLDVQSGEDCREACYKSVTYNCEDYKGSAENYAIIYISRLYKDSFGLFRSNAKMYLLNLFAPQTFKDKAKARFEVDIVKGT